MTRPNVFVVIKTDQERAEFLEAGVRLPPGENTSEGEIVGFHLEDNDPRWSKVRPLLRKYVLAHAPDHELKGRSLSEVLTVQDTGVRHSNLLWLDGYSGQTVEELLALAERYRVDSLVLAFEQAIGQKLVREGRQGLSEEERVVLAVEALEREVNNGGYEQFLMNSSQEFTPIIGDSLERIGCRKTATITQTALEAFPHRRGEDIGNNTADDQRLRKQLSQCDDLYYKMGEAIAEGLFAFIENNKANIRL